jgi:hypothetical protein
MSSINDVTDILDENAVKYTLTSENTIIVGDKIAFGDGDDDGCYTGVAGSDDCNWLTAEETAAFLTQVEPRTLEEKVKMYETFLHQLQMNAEVVMNGDLVRQLISNACSWSYAHRRGNGEPSEDEQQAMINKAFDKLCTVNWSNR